MYHQWSENPQVYDYTPIAGSVSTLLPALSGIVNYYYDNFIKISKSVYDKKSIILKFNNPDFIPRSAKSKFELGASESVKSSTKYNDIATAVEQVKSAFEKQQKKLILQSAKLETEVLQSKREALFIDGVYKLACMMQLWKTNYEDINEGEVHNIVKDVFHNDTSLLLHVFNCKYDDFAAKYNIIYPLSTDIIKNNNSDAMDDTEFGTDIDIPPTALQQTLTLPF